MTVIEGSQNINFSGNKIYFNQKNKEILILSKEKMLISKNKKTAWVNFDDDDMKSRHLISKYDQYKLLKKSYFNLLDKVPQGFFFIPKSKYVDLNQIYRSKNVNWPEYYQPLKEAYYAKDQNEQVKKAKITYDFWGRPNAVYARSESKKRHGYYLLYRIHYSWSSSEYDQARRKVVKEIKDYTY